MRVLLFVIAVAVVATGCSTAHPAPHPAPDAVPDAAVEHADPVPAPVRSRTLPAPELTRVAPAVATVAPVVLRHRAGRWQRVLSALDRHRARAWATGRPGRLRSVYVPGSAVLARDRQMLRAYADRGLTVRGVRTAYRRVRVRSRGPRQVVLEVVDQLRGRPVARDDAGHRRRLPRDRPDRHLVTLRKVDGQWCIATVTSPRPR